jgi:hypothetical protein
LWVDNLDGLLGLVSIGAVELHPWNATVDDIEHADTLVFDPGPGVERQFLTETALRLCDLLTAEGLRPWPKLTGGKGIHVAAPVKSEMTHDEARRYCYGLAQRLARIDPQRYTLSAAMKERPGHLFIDYLRNGRGTTAIGTYSPPARAIPHRRAGDLEAGRTRDRARRLHDRKASAGATSPRASALNLYPTTAERSCELAAFYSAIGRPSVELMIRMLIVGYCSGIRSERRLCEEVHLNLAYRWFCRLGLDGRVPDHSTFSKNRHGRFRQGSRARSGSRRKPQAM